MKSPTGPFWSFLHALRILQGRFYFGDRRFSDHDMACNCFPLGKNAHTEHILRIT